MLNNDSAWWEMLRANRQHLIQAVLVLLITMVLAGFFVWSRGDSSQVERAVIEKYGNVPGFEQVDSITFRSNRRATVTFTFNGWTCELKASASQDNVTLQEPVCDVPFSYFERSLETR